MTQVTKRLIPKDELNKLLSKLMIPREVCRVCEGTSDCIGIDECFPAQSFLNIEIVISEPTQDEIVRMVLS